MTCRVRSDAKKNILVTVIITNGILFGMIVLHFCGHKRLYGDKEKEKERNIRIGNESNGAKFIYIDEMIQQHVLCNFGALWCDLIDSFLKKVRTVASINQVADHETREFVFNVNGQSVWSQQD